MTRSHESNQGAVRKELRTALEHAEQLSTSDDRYTTGWSHKAVHVGDISVLALAMPDKRAA
jgi:hypothetical protein